MARPRLAFVLALALLVPSSGCKLLFPSPVPMHKVTARAGDGAQPSRCLVVFLPGFGDDENVFVEHGFVDALSVRNLPVDTVTAGATFGYYLDRTVIDRLREDVLLPALAADKTREVWLVGISMGGLGALLLARDQDPKTAGVVLFAPYLGGDRIFDEINSAGGLARWEPGRPSTDDDRELWRYLKRVTARHAPPAIYLGAGDQDEHRPHGPHPLAEVLPESHRFRTPGRHDWGPWSVMWADFLDRSDFRAHCAAVEAPFSREPG
jgi:pimeloyl-ACP methyl ester carboxylesterase